MIFEEFKHIIWLLDNTHSIQKRELILEDVNYDEIKRIFDSKRVYLHYRDAFVDDALISDKKQKEEYLDILIYNKEIRKLIKWSYENIVFKLDLHHDIDLKTIDVLIRIFTGMLNKCNINEETKFLIHHNFVKNVYKEYNYVKTYYLPF